MAIKFGGKWVKTLRKSQTCLVFKSLFKKLGMNSTIFYDYLRRFLKLLLLLK
jgi:hypothetical protein